MPEGSDAVHVLQLQLDFPVSPLAFARFRLHPLAFGQIDHEGDSLVAAFRETRHVDQHRDLRKYSFSNGSRRPVVFIVARGRDAADIPLILADALRAASVEVVIGENGGR